MALPPLPELTVFMALALALSLYGLTVSGHFPAEHRAKSLMTPVGKGLLWGTLVVCAVLTLLLVQFAWRHVPLYAAAIGGGAMLLTAPLLLRPLPDSFLNGRRGLLFFTGLALCLALIAETLIAYGGSRHDGGCQAGREKAREAQH